MVQATQPHPSCIVLQAEQCLKVDGLSLPTHSSSDIRYRIIPSPVVLNIIAKKHPQSKCHNLPRRKSKPGENHFQWIKFKLLLFIRWTFLLIAGEQMKRKLIAMVCCCCGCMKDTQGSPRSWFSKRILMFDNNYCWNSFANMVTFRLGKMWKRLKQTHVKLQ